MLNNNEIAKSKFSSLSPSAKKEMVRYISLLKTEESRNRIIDRAIHYLLGKKYIYLKKKCLNDK